MTTHFIISVGTSIIGKYKNATQRQLPGLNYPKDVPYQKPFDHAEFGARDTLYPEYDDIVSFLNKCGYKGAEQTTLERVKKFRKMADNADCRYHLIATDTVDGIFCAYFLGHEVFKPLDHIRYYIPQGLGDALDTPVFTERGIPNLLSCLVNIMNRVNRSEGEHEVIFVPTGGYKIMTPYLTLASILYKKPAYYIHERAINKPEYPALELPAAPLGVNTAEFRAVLVLLENIIGSKLPTDNPYYNAIPKSFQTLVYRDEGTFKYTAFGKRLKYLFDRTARSPLEIRTSENSLIQQLDSPYQKIFLEMTHLGTTVWLGDKAPEMADHARYHHLNLFSYAELLLLPILTNKRSAFLSPTELFLLLGIIYLHDCGHSMATFPTPQGNIPLLPTEIRIFHHLLGWKRLQNPSFQEALTRQDVHLDKDTFENIATLSVYHRKKMPLLRGNSPYVGPDGARFKPVVERKLTQDGHTLEGDRLALLVALFRIIDGMDKQIARAGDVVEISMKAEAILADLPHLWDRVVRLKNAISRIPPVVRQHADEILQDLIPKYCGLESVTGKTQKTKEDRLQYLELQHTLALLEESQHFPLLWEYLDARVRFFFYALQPSYYYSDLLLKMPRVRHQRKNGKNIITILYPRNSDRSGAEKIHTIWKKIQEWINANVGSNDPERYLLEAKLQTPEQVLKGVRDENSSAVQEILGKNNLSIEIPDV